MIGAAVTQALLSRGTKVVACDDFSIGSWQAEKENLVWAKTDVSAPGMTTLLEKYGPDAVIHCAAHPGGLSLSDPVEDVKVNALGSIRIFDWCARAGKTLIYLSSSVIYGDQPPGFPIRESAEVMPGTIYAACKIACENFLRILADGYGLQWTVLRLFSTYGAGHKPGTSQGIVNIMLTQLLAGNRLIVRGSLDRVRDLLYVDDAARAIVESVFAREARGQVLNVGTGTGIIISQLIESLCRGLGRQMSAIEIVEEPGTVGDPLWNVADCSMAQEILGFSAQNDIETGISKLIRNRIPEI